MNLSLDLTLLVRLAKLVEFHSSESMTTTSEGSAIETRIQQLKEQLQARKEEAKRLQNEQKQKKKELLRQQEAQLKRKLEVSQ